MNTIRAIFWRTLGRARNSLSTGFVCASFLSAAAISFGLDLNDAEGAPRLITEVWATSLAPLLPILAAFLAMDVWSEERRTGRIDLLLSLAVRERDLVLGKFLGVLGILAGTIALSFVALTLTFACFASTALTGCGLLTALPAFLVLLLQGALWAAVSVAVSACFAHGAVSASVSLVLTAVLPRGLWAVLLVCSPAGRTAFGEMPLDAHVVDFCAGSLALGTVAVYAIFTVVSLFITSKIVCRTRFSGRGSRLRRLSFLLTVFLAIVCGGMFALLTPRLPAAVELPTVRAHRLSPRLNQLLSESSDSVTLTVFLSRRDGGFRAVARFLRQLRAEAQAVGGLRINVAYVDPRWDFGSSGRLIRMGVREKSLVIERGLRHVDVSLAGGLDERAFTAAFQSVLLPPTRRDIYWTTGHGEISFSDYGTWGMSDIARELSRAGYRNHLLDLTGDGPLPAGCALIIAAGSKTEFSRPELGRLEKYLKSGGRLLVMMGPPGEGGLATILPSWGIRPEALPRTDARTLSGTDVIVSDFSDHAVAQPLVGTRIVLERPLSFVGSAVSKVGAGADAIEFKPLARLGSAVVAAVSERGTSAGADIAVRPMRLLIIGDASFVQNGQLAARANANREFFLNSVAYLAGSEIPRAVDHPEDAVLVTGLDRSGRLRILVILAGAVPLAVLLVLAAFAFRRRCRR